MEFSYFGDQSIQYTGQDFSQAQENKLRNTFLCKKLYEETWLLRFILTVEVDEVTISDVKCELTSH